MNGLRLAVDYGTSHTVAMLRRPDGRVRPLLFDGSPRLPSAVCAHPDGRLLAGDEALRAARVDPGRCEPHPKRRVGEETLVLGDREITPTEAIAATLGLVWAEACRSGGEPPVASLLTHPTAWGPLRRAVLAEAAVSAGLADVELLPEPVAAAGYLATLLGERLPVGGCVVIYDLGAGTFDTSVVRRTTAGPRTAEDPTAPDSRTDARSSTDSKRPVDSHGPVGSAGAEFEILAARGLDDVGGVDLDALVVGEIGAVVAETDPAVWKRLTEPDDPAAERASRQFQADARAAREALSRQPAAELVVPLADQRLPVTREAFERIARPVLARTVEGTAAVIRESRVRAVDVAGLFLVGGATRTPLVATVLHRALGVPPTALDHPELAIAEGAAHAFAPPVPEPAGNRDATSASGAPVDADATSDARSTGAPPTPITRRGVFLAGALLLILGVAGGYTLLPWGWGLTLVGLGCALVGLVLLGLALLWPRLAPWRRLLRG